MKINTVARTKFGVYSCPSLHIAENQEWGKDKRRIFCSGLLKTNSFSFFFFFFPFFLIFWIFPFSKLFLDFFLFLFFWIFLFLIFFYHLMRVSSSSPHEGVLTFTARGHLYLFSHVGAYLIGLTIQTAKSGFHLFSHIGAYLIELTI